MAPAQAPDSGRVAGRVIDRETGRPVAGARIALAGRPDGVLTDLDGRYRTGPVPAGHHMLRTVAIGYQPVQVDSVIVAPNETVVVDVALRPAAIELQGVTVEAEAVPKPSTAAGLLAVQQAAPTVSDGVSAEAMSRTPDSDAADAIARVTGIAVVDNKYVVVRGLPERYSNTLLNGAELTSPEPLRRVVPLDIFPASLLESIVTNKTATPDRPGDFSGGSVEIRTKEFPERFVFQAKMSQGYDSRTTFNAIPVVPRGGTDFLGVDDGRRALPADAPTVADGPNGRAERFAESLRNVWAPPAQRAAPELGLGLNLGGQLGTARPLGYALSWTYLAETEYVPERLFQLFSDPTAPAERALRYTESRVLVDWGAIANFSLRLGAGTKVGWKNLYTRTADETALQNAGYDTENSRVVREYQVKYAEQDFLQSQLSGEHVLRFLFGSRLEWRLTGAWAGRDEPDNRQAQYILEEASGEYTQASQVPSRLWTRFLDDRLYSAQVDWAFPFGLRLPADAQLKVGGVYRVKDRVFDAALYRYTVDNLAPNARDVARLPPERAFAPENVGTAILFSRADAYAQSYDADDDLSAMYAMLDLPVLPRVRFVGGARQEDWRLFVYPGGRQSLDGEITSVWAKDLLWSGNLTLRLGDRSNLRLGAFRSVARPDAREVSPDSYVPVAGDCELQGNQALERSLILNGDVRWEVYPRPGEILALSGFYKAFDSPIIETVDTPGGGQCRVRFNNATSARNYGAEIEVRKTLDFLPGPLARLFAGVNVTLVSSRVTIDSTLGFYEPDLPLQGQSPYLLNVTVAYLEPERGRSASLLLHYFADRVARYGRLAGARQGPNLVERGRPTLDAKIEHGFGPQLSLALAFRNITGAPVELVHERADGGHVVAGRHDPGIGVTLHVGYDF